MKILKNRLSKAGIVMLTIFSMSCGSDFLDINTDPNNPSEASLNLLLPAAQLSAGFWTTRNVQENASAFIQHYTRLNQSTYNITGANFSNDFNSMFDQALKDLQTIVKQGEEAGFKGYSGIAKVMKAYLYMVLVDTWGDVPYTEALQGEDVLFPHYEDDAAVYDHIIDLVDVAKADLKEAIENSESPVSSDLIYGGNYSKWVKAANTLKLRLLLNIRLVDAARSKSGIETLITENNFISSNADDFQFTFGSSVSPMNQHPIYQQEYIPGSKTQYMNNYFMYNLIAKNDPRLPFYIFRQGEDDDLDFQTQPCSQRSDCVYGWLGGQEPSNGLPALGAAADGYIGRDHGDPSGIPGDNTIRATFGVYPIGGSYDVGPGGGERRFDRGHGTGAGIMPWLTNFHVSFMLAEAAITLGTPGDPLALTLKGIEDSFSKVEAFGLAIDPNNAIAMDQADVDDYLDDISDRYTAAGNNSQRLNIVMTEKFYASYGNGFESYTDYRRTGMPNDQPSALAPSGPFPLRLPYPPGELSSNPNAPNPVPLVSEPIFWDAN
ncbi:MAG: SusD/RagB family nutrient-binding outer membrane lipoprotein [Imperialibacter sp.]|uniref:SusD/RagB family nutrient-binding outer membrane lipoprotein n=1 Tax=Imperialibacter sp. TaxID=2038411 RepID=UPI0032EE281C